MSILLISRRSNKPATGTYSGEQISKNNFHPGVIKIKVQGWCCLSSIIAISVISM